MHLTSRAGARRIIIYSGVIAVIAVAISLRKEWIRKVGVITDLLCEHERKDFLGVLHESEI